MKRAEIAGKIGGMVGGFKRRERQKFLVGLLKTIEMEEYPNLRLTSSLAKKLITGFSGYKSISNDVLVKEFGRANNKVKQQNLDDIVTLIVSRHDDTYKELWREAKRKIDEDAEAFKKLKIEELKSTTM
ncbi:MULTISPECIES: hypothetical protein [unclassified Pseudomonas]|uniref:hypothetical protein n=1 Tax=unclassified Pseudomonas TaxID=196821 RepID=UPI0021BAFF80|nr:MULTISPECIES: hypothetical protein [unclassified Pseudomonas]MCT8163455.1 hypothetical protein [Pseudomonas sp. HD6422]MCT8186347.1 hypothetical protein [Pseudomonas sp. HD6421]